MLIETNNIGSQSLIKFALHHFSNGDLKNHRLYQDVNSEFFDKDRKIVRDELKKTGDRLVLLGGVLAGKTIVRIVGEKIFNDWKKAYLAKELWAELGFDYVPIEPMIKYFKTKDLKYRVYCQILGVNLETVMLDKRFKFYHAELEDKVLRIRKGLLKLGVHSAHHFGKKAYYNFVIEGDLSLIEKGDVKIYAIDIV